MSTEMQTCPSCGELVPVEYVICVWCGYDLTAEHIRRSGIRIDRRQAINRIYRVIVDPLKVFKEISLIPDNRGGRMVLYAIGIMMTLNMLVIFNKLENLAFNSNEVRIILASLQSGRTISITLKFIISLAFLLVQPFVLFLIFALVWRVATRVLSILSRSVGGKGDREKIRATLGYSLAPVLLAWSVAWLFRIITPKTTVSDPNDYNSVEDALVQVAEQGVGTVTLLLLYIGWIWSMGLAVIGMRHSAKLSWVESALVTGLPFIVFMTISL